MSVVPLDRVRSVGRALGKAVEYVVTAVGAFAIVAGVLLYIAKDGEYHAVETPYDRFNALAERLCGPHVDWDGGIPFPSDAHYDCLTEHLLRAEKNL